MVLPWPGGRPSVRRAATQEETVRGPEHLQQPEKCQLPLHFPQSSRSVVSPESLPADWTALSAFSFQNEQATRSLIRTSFRMFLYLWWQLGSCPVTLGLCERHTICLWAGLNLDQPALSVVNLNPKVTFSFPAGRTCECRLLVVSTYKRLCRGSENCTFCIFVVVLCLFVVILNMLNVVVGVSQWSCEVILFLNIYFSCVFVVI